MVEYVKNMACLFQVEPMKPSGSYYVTLTGINPVSTETINMNFTIDTPITGITVTTSLTKLEILRNMEITWTVDMDGGGWPPF